MKRLLPALLAALLLLTACAGNPGAEETQTADPSPTGDAFVFTRENFPRLNGSTSAIPLGEAIASVLLGESRRRWPIWYPSPRPPPPTAP